MKHKFKIIIAVMIMGLLTGCGENNVAKIESYLEDKYNEDFEFKTIINSSPIPFAKSTVTTAVFDCESYSDLVITASYNSKTKKYSDNMVAIVYHKQMMSTLDDILSSIGIYDYKIERNIAEKAVDSDYSFEEYMSDSKTYKNVTVVTTSTVNEAIMNDFANSLIDKDISLNGRVAQLYIMDEIDDRYELNNSTIGDNVVTAFNFKVADGKIEWINCTD